MEMLSIINEFVDTMIQEKSKFEEIQSEVQRVETYVKDRVDQMEKTINFSINSGLSGNHATEIDPAIESIFSGVSSSVRDGIHAASSTIQETINGMKFIYDFEKHFTVSVFGKVKAGKSYIGNFVMGNTLRDLNIKSSYDVLRPISVSIYDRGKQSQQSQLSTFDEELDELATGKTETTSTIQWFNIGALSWFDTPGIGSVTWENEMLAKEYVKNSDLVIYACNSDAAGTRQDFAEMKQLLDMGKPVLLLLTQSDTNEEDEDEDGNLISELVPKSEKDRQDQEAYIITTLNEQGMTDILKYDVLTVSAKLANIALEENDEDKFEKSNMGKFLVRLTEITKNEAAQMKRNTPKDRINKMIDDIIGKIEAMVEDVSEKCSSIETQKKELENREIAIVQEIKADVNQKVMILIDKKESKIEKEKIDISEEEIISEISRIVNEVVGNVCKKELNLTRKAAIDLRMSDIGNMKMNKDVIEWEEVKVNRTVRNPKGLFEHIGSFFGKTYFDHNVERHKRQSEFDVGINRTEVTAKIMKQLDEVFSSAVADFVNDLAEGYYEPVSKLKISVLSELKQTVNELQDLRLE